MPRLDNRITVDSVRGVLDGSFPGNLGIEPLEVEDDHTTGRIVVDSRHLHPGGFVHGGVWTALADTVAAWGTFRHLPDGHDFTTVELKLNVFAAGVEGGKNCFPMLLEAVEVCSLGQITGRLQEIVGRFRPMV